MRLLKTKIILVFFIDKNVVFCYNLYRMWYYVRNYYSDYNIIFESLSPTIINDSGRLITNIATDTTVYYKITITKNELSEIIILSSTIPA